MCVSPAAQYVPEAVADPLSGVRGAAWAGLEEAAKSLSAPSEDVRRFPLRFRPDGKGGELATPLPLGLHLDARALADALNALPLPCTAAPSGGWLALTLNGDWDGAVRCFEPRFPLIDAAVPPVPDFPARIDPALWRLSALAGVTDPQVAARFDRGSPAFRVQWTAAQPPVKGNSRRLVNECALLYEQLAHGNASAAAKQLIALTDAYRAAPAEGALVQRALNAGLASLQI